MWLPVNIGKHREEIETHRDNIGEQMNIGEAFKKMESETFDAIVLDFQMPEMDGMEALKSIKAKRPESQIILLTGFATVEKGVQAMKEGAADFMEKPADLEVLSQKIKEAKAEKMVIVEKQATKKVIDIIKKYGY